MKIKNIYIFFAFLMLCKIGLTQPELKIIRRITSTDGLLTNGIKYTYQDSQGFMWFTYEKGFQRWDGLSAKNYSYNTDTNINNSYRYCRPILEDKNGNFFIGTLHNGLIKLNRKTDTYTSYQHDPLNPENSMVGRGVHEMFLDSSGIIWLSTIEGLTRFNPKSESFKNYIPKPDIRYDPCNWINSVFRDSRGVLWVGTRNGLYHLNESNDSLEQIITDPVLPKHLNGFYCIAEDYNSKMWFGSAWGLFGFDRESDTWTYFETNDANKPERKSSAHISCMVEYEGRRKHELWLGTPDGLMVMDLRTMKITHLNPENGYDEITNTGPAQYLYLDSNNILWASLGGLILIDLNDRPFEAFDLFSYPDSSNTVPGYCFYQDEDENIWIGSKSHGLYIFDKELNFISNHKPCNWNPEESNERHNNMVSYMYEDSKGRIWMNAGPTYLSIFDKHTKEFHPVEMNVKSYYPGQMLVDPYDIVWVAGHDGLHKCTLNDDYVLEYELYENPSLANNPVDQMLFDSKGRFWVITRNNGVYCLHPEDRDSMLFKRYMHEHYRNKFTIEYNARSMIEDDYGGIWFRSEKEIFCYKPELDSLVPDTFFNNNYKCNIYSMSRDKNGVFWFVIGLGVVAYDPGNSFDYPFRVFDYRVGVTYTSIERSTFFKDKQGYFYMGEALPTEGDSFVSIPIAFSIPHMEFHPWCLPDLIF